jgi:hypothetical protein
LFVLIGRSKGPFYSDRKGYNLKKYAVIIDWFTNSATIFEYDTKEEAQEEFDILKKRGIYEERIILVEVLSSFNDQ